jgi:hypothetical protein
MSNDIATNRISCKPQKLQAMLTTAKIRRGSWSQVGQAGGKKWLPSTVQAWNRRGSAGDMRLASVGWPTRVIDSVLLPGSRSMTIHSPEP